MLFFARCILSLFVAGLPVLAQDFAISSFNRSAGKLAWTNAFLAGVCGVQTAPAPVGPWTPEQNVFTTTSTGETTVGVTNSSRFYRLIASDVSGANPDGFANLTHCYGRIRTIAGNGTGRTDNVNYWEPGFEGGFATNAALSRPHYAMADANGNIFVVDKNSHSVLKITTDGRIHTYAGTHQAGNGPDAATTATNVALNVPNGLWVGADNSVYVLDTGNGKVRWVNTNGIMTTLFTVTGGISGGRGLWVRNDRGLVYFVNGNDVKSWAPGVSIKSVNSVNFNDPGNICVRSDGNLVVTDRGNSRVYLLLATAGTTISMFGNGTSAPVVPGTPAQLNGLYGVRAVWPFPSGGYLLGTHEGSQVLYIDSVGIMYVLVDGDLGGVHAGDDAWFFDPGFKISEVRSVTMDQKGNILIVENDSGFVRQIDFQRLNP